MGNQQQQQQAEEQANICAKKHALASVLFLSMEACMQLQVCFFPCGDQKQKRQRKG